MSVPTNPEFLRKEAKALLKQCRSGDPRAIGRIRTQLHRMTDLNDVQIAETIKLADVHHALARERGHDNWGDLKREDSLVEQFLVAVKGGSLKDAQRLLGALPEMASESIHAACAIGDAPIVMDHLNQNPALLNAEHRDWPPLFYACASPLGRVTGRQSAGLLECATVLLDRGADPNSVVMSDSAESDGRMSAIQRALLSANMPIMVRLMQRGADPPDFKRWASRMNERQPVMGQIFREYFGARDVPQQFKEKFERIRKQQSEGQLWGSDKWWFHAHGQFHSGGEVEIPIIYTETLKAIVERKALDPNRTGLDGRTMLHRAVTNATPEVVKLLVDNGADLDRRTPDGKTALVLAVRAGKNLNADALRSRGATAEGLRPVDELIGACVRADSAAVHAILKAHPHAAVDPSPEDSEVLVAAAAMNILDRAKLIIACGFDPGSFGESGITALHAAAWHGHVAMVQLLLSFHAPVNARDVTYGSSPLAWAAHGSRHKENAEDDYCAIVNSLVDAGADYECAVSRSGVRPEDIATPRVASLLGKGWRT